MSIIKNKLNYKRAPAVLLAAVFAVGFVFSAAYFSSSVFAEEEGQEGTTETETILPPEDPILPEGGPMLMCGPPPQEITVQTYKVICESETDLPNWGAGTGLSQITETTATDYVAQHPNCHLANGWDFQWGYDGQVSTENGDFVGPAGTGWTTFNSSTIVPINGSSRIWVRENLQADFIPFAGPPELQNNVSAEMYCHEDILNYDNYDYIYVNEFPKR